MEIVEAAVLAAFRCTALDDPLGYGLVLGVEVRVKEGDTYVVSHYRGKRFELRFSRRNLDLIYKIRDVVGVNSWGRLKGHRIRVKINMNGESIQSIGNLLRDDWVVLPEVKDKEKVVVT